MNFIKNETKAVDFNTLEVGSVANATLTGFRYVSDFCIGIFSADEERVEAIIGSKADYPISTMLDLKRSDVEVQISFRGTKVSNGVSYPRYNIEF